MREDKVHKVWIGLGSNLGDRSSNLSKACALIAASACRIIKYSSVYESASWGYISEHSFYNQCLIVETKLGMEELLGTLKGIERTVGRVSTKGGYEDRKIDIDLLFFDNMVYESDTLKIPHPGIADRKFVLEPLREIAPEKIHPVLHQSIDLLAQICVDRGEVLRLDK